MSAMSSGTQPSCIPRSSSGSSPRLLTQAPPSRFSHPHLEGSLSGHQAKLSIDAAVSKLSRAVGRPQTSNSGAINFRLNGRGLASLVIIDSTNTLIEGEGFQATFATAVDRNPTAVNWLDIEQTSVGDGIFQPIAVPTPSAILLRRPTPSLIEFHTPSGSVSSNMHLFTHHSKLSMNSARQYLSRRGPPAPITIPSTEALCSVEPQLPTFSTTAQSAHAQLQTRPPDVLKDNPSAEGSGLHSQETQRHLNLLTGDDDLQSSDELTVLEKALAPQTRLRELAGAGDVRSGPIRKNRSFRADSSKDCGAGQNQLCPQQDKFEPSQGRGQVGVVPAPLSDPSAIAPRETLGDSASTSQDMALRSSSPHTFHSTESTRRNVIPAPRRLSPSSESSTGHPLDHQPAPLGGAARTLVTSVSWSPTVSPKSVILPLPKNAGSAEAMKHLEVPGSALSNAMSSDSVRRDTYMPQSSDLLFSPEFIFSALGVPEHAQTTSAILPEDYSAVAGAENAQTIRGHEDAIGLEHVSAYWMTKEDSATLPLSPPILAAPNSGGGTRPRSAFDGAQIITSFASPTSGKYSPSMNPKGSNTENSLGTKTPVLPQRALTERSLSLPIEDASLTRVPKNNTATVDVSVSISNSVQASRSDGSSRSRGAAQVAVNALSRKGSKDRLALMADAKRLFGGNTESLKVDTIRDGVPVSGRSSSTFPSMLNIAERGNFSFPIPRSKGPPSWSPSSSAIPPQYSSGSSSSQGSSTAFSRLSPTSQTPPSSESGFLSSAFPRHKHTVSEQADLPLKPISVSSRGRSASDAGHLPLSRHKTYTGSSLLSIVTSPQKQSLKDLEKVVEDPGQEGSLSPSFRGDTERMRKGLQTSRQGTSAESQLRVAPPKSFRIESTPLRIDVSARTLSNRTREAQPSAFPVTPRDSFLLISSREQPGDDNLLGHIPTPVITIPALDIPGPNARPLAPPVGPRSRPANQPTFPDSSIRALRSMQSVSSGSPSDDAGVPLSSPSREGSDSSPLFDDIPIKWKGLTLDQAKWTFTSKELQSLVAQAIVQSTAVTSIRLLSEEVLEKELPVELERLEDLRDSIKSRLQYQIRRRNVILRSLPLHVDGPDVKTARRLMSDLTKVSHWFEKLTSELYTVMDQIAQIRQLRDNHLASALMMGLQKMNGAFLRVSSENELLSQTLIDVEAERDEGWGKALEVERELDEMRGKLAVPQSGDSAIDCGPSSGHRSRVSAARKTSSRASKASLRTNHPLRSARPSHSGMKFGSLTFPYPPSSMAFDSVDTSAPPVPDLLSPTRQSMDRHDSMTSRLTSTPSVTRAMFLAQHEVLELLGLSTADLDDLGRHDKGKTRSWSASQLTDLPLTTSSRRSSAHLPYSPRYF